MKIKKGDTVLVIAGKDKGRKGKVLRVFSSAQRIALDGLNIRKKHRKPIRSGEHGQIIEIPAPFSISNVKLLCVKCQKPTRVGYKLTEKKKTRVCKRCNAEI